MEPLIQVVLAKTTDCSLNILDSRGPGCVSASLKVLSPEPGNFSFHWFSSTIRFIDDLLGGSNHF